VINLDHEVTLAMTDRSAPPRSVMTLRQEYFDLEFKEGGKMIHGVFVRMESHIHGPLVEVTHMASNKEAKSILSKIAHCPSAWWYWHWVKNGYTQGAILSLLNSFEVEAADNAHDSTYDPQARTITSMFVGDMTTSGWIRSKRNSEVTYRTTTRMTETALEQRPRL
jgi:hypothetical protein